MRFSIVIPVFNASELVEISINSLKKQSFEDFEVILIDDGSTDDSYKIIIDLILDDSRFKIYKQTNGGPGSARNTGITLSKGDFIGFLDSDDYFHCDYLSKVNESIVINSSDIVVSDFVKVDVLGNVLKKYESKFDSCINGIDAFRYVLRSERITSMSQNKVFKRELFDFVKFPSQIIVNEDSSTLFKLFHKSSKVSFVSEFLFYYVQHPASTMNSFSDRKLNDRFIASEIVLDYLIKELDSTSMDDDYTFYYLLNVIFSGSMQISLQSEQPMKYMSDFISKFRVGMFSLKNISIIARKYKVKGWLLFVLKVSPVFYVYGIRLAVKVLTVIRNGKK